jgi:hypothetical protein
MLDAREWNTERKYRIWNYYYGMFLRYSGRRQQLLLGVDFEAATWKRRE